MLELLKSLFELVAGLLGVLGNLVVDVSGLVWNVLQHLHDDAPRLEGVLVGVALAWLMLRRDKHPLLRVLSAPLKLVLDILDLVWDQCVEIVGDVWGVVVNWVRGSLTWCWSKVVGAGSWVMDKLRALKNRLLAKKAE